MPAVPDREADAAQDAGGGPVGAALPLRKREDRLGNVAPRRPPLWYASSHRLAERRCVHMAKDRFVEVYSQGLTNVEKIIVDTETGVNYVLASSAMTVGCGMSVLVDAEGKPIVTPME